MHRQFMTKVFLVEDDEVFGKIIQKSLEQHESCSVSLFHSGQELLGHLHQNPDIVSMDFHLPDMTGLEILRKVKKFNPDIGTIILSGQQELDVVVEAYREGADEYIIKDRNALVRITNVVKQLSKQVNLRKELETLQDKIIDRHQYKHIIGQSPAMMNILKMVQKVQKVPIQVLITGESGTGKEVIAQTLHYNSPRKKGPFIGVNMSAIPADLIESELFGHEKGAFTGANSRRIGKFEEANGGTIFLDEISEMDLSLQSKLLRVLQESKVTRLGSNKEIALNVRVVSASNKNLIKRIEEGLFREDLYYRLLGFLIELPALRDRENDIILLARHFMAVFCKANKMAVKVLEKEALYKLMQHSWPGNVRELKSVVERAALMADGNVVQAHDIMYASTLALNS